MKTVADVLKGEYPVNHEEHSIIDFISFSIFSLIMFISITIKMLINGKINEWINALIHINIISLSIFIWLLFLLYKFLYGYFYIKRFNQAVEKGIHFSGTLIEKKRMIRRAARSRFTEIHPIVMLDSGEVLKAPSYYHTMPAKNECDVYLYKKKYYFAFHFYT
ncbi:MAG: hypothetical protein K2O42_07930 [Oscillospiraceae bacterium]|nr:hypothetical protein [Oscillospiraceae bacterium]